MKKITDYSRAELEYCIDQWVICQRNAERNRAIYKRAMFDGVSQEKIAAEFGLAPRQIQYIIKDVSNLLLKHL